MSIKKVLSILSVVLLFSVILVAEVQARPKEQTVQGCETEAADYLVDVLWVEFGPDTIFNIYEMELEEIENLIRGMGAPEEMAEDFADFIFAGGTVVGFFGPCCFEGGPRNYLGPRDNTFPTGCCKPPDFSNFPFEPLLGGGDGNPCKCQSGLHDKEGKEKRTYGGEYIDGIPPRILSDEVTYVIVNEMAPEEWMAIPVLNP